MSQLAVSAKNLSKAYVLRSAGKEPVTAAEAFLAWVKHPLRRSTHEQFWALRQVDFEIARGEVVGVVGRNGAGKSTLLKILSRITSPTHGRVEVHGRLGSLLEVGTGFHPELNGRENIFLNGAVLGMSGAQVRRRYDEIVEFAGVEKFLETPVKRYSSGMYIRLAFAVAAHLEVDVLLVDEVLAVGDADFQARCLGKMRDVAADGRTVIFVSHQMQSVISLCTRAMFMEAGSLRFVGDVGAAIDRYQSSYVELPASTEAGHRPGTGETRMIFVRPDKPGYRPQEEKRFTFSLRRSTPLAEVYGLSMAVIDARGMTVTEFDSRHAGVSFDGRDAEWSGEFTLRTPWLQPGRYRVDAKLHRVGPWVDVWDGACHFHVLDTLPYAFTAPPDALAAAVALPDFDCVSASLPPRAG